MKWGGERKNFISRAAGNFSKRRAGFTGSRPEKNLVILKNSK